MALFLSRQGALIDWSVADFLGFMGARLELPDLRAACWYALVDGTAGARPRCRRTNAARSRNAPPVPGSLTIPPDQTWELLV